MVTAARRKACGVKRDASLERVKYSANSMRVTSPGHVNLCELIDLRMDIALLVAGLPPEVLGGAEMQAARTAALLAARHRVSVYTRSATLPDELRGLIGCTVIRRCAVTRPGLRFVADIVLSLCHLYRRRHTLEVILAYQTVIDGLIAVLAGRLWSIPTLVWVRSEVEFRMAGSRQTRCLSPWVLRHATRIAVQSATLRDSLLEELRASGRLDLARSVEAKLCVIGNGVALPPLAPPGPDGELLFVGRLGRQGRGGFDCSDGALPCGPPDHRWRRRGACAARSGRARFTQCALRWSLRARGDAGADGELFGIDTAVAAQ